MKDIVIDFGGITDDNKNQLRLINTTCFPITYADGFYKDIVKAKNESLNKFAYHNGFIIGSICSRIQPCDESNKNKDYKDKCLYIMTLGVLPSYRGRMVGSKLLQSVLDYIDNKAEEKCPSSEDIKEVRLHVQISNEDGINFYEKLGFEKGKMVENYYKRIDPPHCYVLTKKL